MGIPVYQAWSGRKPNLHLQLAVVCQALAQRGLNFVVAGGYARDIAAGVQPKDADVCVFGDVCTLGALPASLLHYALEHDLQYRQIPNYHVDDTSDFAARLNGVCKIGDVDIVFYSSAATWYQVVGQFDFNINQFYFPSSIPRYSTGTHNRGEPELYAYEPSFTANDVVFAGDMPALVRDGLLTVRDDYSFARLRYMQDKWQDIKVPLLEWVRYNQEA